tara:strand:- start:50 stop:415 length:366 start_codon:yes stop_codon:yes gene_type:complete
MRVKQFVYDSWNGVMSLEHNPLKNIPSLQARHLILQCLAWTWCTTFSLSIGSIYVFGFTAIAHVLILAAIVITVSTFETAKRKPHFFLKSGYHSYPRARQNMYVNGEKIKLDRDDPGGEHE